MEKAWENIFFFMVIRLIGAKPAKGNIRETSAAVKSRPGKGSAIRGKKGRVNGD